MNYTSYLDKSKVYAVVGASNDPKKFGSKIYELFKKGGFEVYPVNPNREEIQGDKAYSSLSELPKKPFLVSVITPPDVSQTIMHEAIKAQIENIWFQPGAHDQWVSDSKGKINAIVGPCIITNGFNMLESTESSETSE